MQESGGYDVELSEDRLSNDIDKVGMDTTNDIYQEHNRNSATEENTMISNLPLLFANGHPISLEKITMAQLERFISFMVHCSLGHDTTTIIRKPQWWPQDIKFSNPLMRPKKINDNWMANLKKLVFRCYTYHRSEYLLRFCSYLAQYPHKELEYVNNWDSTTSLYHKTSGKLLVTFRNENMIYDKKNDSPRKTLLLHNASSSGYGGKAKQPNTPMIVQPQCDDIYLCDNCDAEFVGLAKMKEHEKVCGEQYHPNNGSRSSTPDSSAIEPESQNKFLKYFGLCSNNIETESTSENNIRESDNSIIRRTSRRVRGSIKFARCTTIPFSSPAGLALAKQSKAMTEETQKERLDRIERHVIAPVLSSSCRPKWLDTDLDYDRWVVTYKQNRDKLAESSAHQYKFVKSQKKKLVLSVRSQLLYLMCRPIYVVVTRLSQKQIDILKQNPSRYKYPQHSPGSVTLIKRVGPACKTKRLRDKSYAQDASKSLKHASTGDEFNPIVIEDNTADVSTLTTSTKEDLTVPVAVRSCMDKKKHTKSIAEKRSCSPDTIMLIDLCSSDEEDDRSSLVLHCDENRDPMNSKDSSILAMTLLRKMTNKHYEKPYICPVASTTDRLSSNALNKDRNENCSNKSRTGVLNEYAHLSAILRSTP